MVMNSRQEISLLKTQNAALLERIRVLESKFEPKPPPRVPEVPKWAGSNSQDVGASYSGPPSVSQQGAAGIVGVKPDAQGNWTDPFGQKRDSSGALIPHSTAGMVERRPDGPLRSPQHEEAVRILDDGLSNT
jgi:hypothetical protein